MTFKRPLPEPVVIVGSSCRFAGGVTSPSKLWDAIADPRDLSKEVPDDRFKASSFYHPDGRRLGTTNAVKGYWMEQDCRAFDAAFFNIPPREAEAMDPQQRLLLEVTYEALESAGYTLKQYAGQSVAVYAGVMTADYDTLSQRDDLTASQYYATGNARSMISNRISYVFDFHGPSVTIDTACSSSLVALHQAVMGLRSGESVMACVAGANLMLAPEQFIAESNLNMLSPSGHCRMWDAGADGYARGEGIATLVLKTLSKALADGDQIQAVIRETGVNSDGRTKGITTPNPTAQAALIGATYRRAGLEPNNSGGRCQYFEAHGTGTQVGDPVEAAAIHEAFFDQDEDAFAAAKMIVGSIKTVIGHTEGAAGLAGVLKATQSLGHALIPPNLHMRSINPKVMPFYSHLRVPTELEPWPEVPAGEPLRASVNSFGFGGTNAHIILERYDAAIHDRLARSFTPRPSNCGKRDPPESPPGVSIKLPLLLSANSPKSLAAVAEQYRDYLTLNHSVTCDELAWHIVSSRTTLPLRLPVPGTSREELIRNLTSSARDDTSLDGAVSRSKTTHQQPRILGIFTGQGAQWTGMSKGLLHTNRLYRQSIRDSDAVLHSCRDPPPWTLEEQIEAEGLESHVNEPFVSQTLCTAVQIALVDLLWALGVTFSTVIGHSSGEIAAAYAARRLSARDAMLIAYYRGMHAQLACREENGSVGPGAMMAVKLSPKEAEELCAETEWEGRFCVAASNSSSDVTLSGDSSAVHQARKVLKQRGRAAKLLQVEAAYHSHHMQHLSSGYLHSLQSCDISPLPTENNGAGWISTVNKSMRAPTAKTLSGSYWGDNMVQPVLFHQAIVEALSNDAGLDFVIEVGPHPALKRQVMQTSMEELGHEIPHSGLLNRQKHDATAFSDFLGAMWTRFGPSAINMRRFVETSACPWLTTSRLNDMPTYPWDHSQLHHRESRITRQYQFRENAPHELLGVRTRDDTEYQLRWRNVIRLDDVPWIEHHKFQGLPMLPASAYCVMAVDAAHMLLSGRQASLIELEDVEFLRAITICPGSQGVETLFSLTPDNQLQQTGGTEPDIITASFILTSVPLEGLSTMCKNVIGRIRVVLGEQSAHILPSRPENQPETLEVSVKAFYAGMTKVGIEYSGPFKALQTMHRRYNFASTTVRKYQASDSTSLQISPATLDVCLQTCFATFSSPGDRALWTAFLPSKIRKVSFNLALHTSEGSNNDLVVDAHLTEFQHATQASPATITGDILVFDQQGQSSIQVEGLTVASLATPRPKDDVELYMHTVMDLNPEDEIVAISQSSDARVDSSLRGDHEGDDLTKSGRVLDMFREHLSRVVQQFAHRFPRMHVLGLTDENSNLVEHVLDGLGQSFASYTIGQGRDGTSEHHLGRDDQILEKVAVAVMDFDNVSASEHHAAQFDLVILSPSILPDGKSSTTLGHIRKMMKPSGFLITVHTPSSQVMGRMVGSQGAAGHRANRPLTPPDWPDVLDHCGYVAAARNSDQYFSSGSSLIIRQVRRPDHSASPQQLHNRPLKRTPSSCLLISGPRMSVTGLTDAMRARLAASFDHIQVAPSLEDLDAQAAGAYPAVVNLADLDQPLFTSMTSAKLETLKMLLRPEMTMLWVTCQARSRQPGQAASFGFARTVLAEVPDLKLQMLDLEAVDDGTPKMVADAMVRLLGSTLNPRQGGDMWNHEPEIYIEGGKRLIPRIMPYDSANDRFNASRRVISKPVNTVEWPIEIFSTGTQDKPGNPETRRGSTNPWMTVGQHQLLLKVDCSSAQPLHLDDGFSAYICIGRDMRSGDRLVAMSQSNASFVLIPDAQSSSVQTHPSSADDALFLGLLLRIVFGLMLARRARGQQVSLVDPDEQLVYVAEGMLPPMGVSVKSYTRNATLSSTTPGREFLHPALSSAELKKRFGNGVLVDFHKGRELSRRLESSCPEIIEPCAFVSADQLRATSQAVPTQVRKLFQSSVELVLATWRKLAISPTCAAPRPLSVNALVALGRKQRIPPFQVVDWRLERNVEHIIQPQIGTNMLRGDRTYLLVGLTRDMGQSLCSLLVEQGARHIVLASRSPHKNPRWRDCLISQGVEVQFKVLDVTSLDAVHELKRRIEETMPPVAGVVNGAMVLQDGVFAQMTLDTLTKVLAPKTAGSANLDCVFDGKTLEFFIMTSSFAAIGGHAGQSNYAAANMYMNGLAASRRHRGLAASVLNIGVIYGLGFLHRDRAELYAGLEREGYPPISERALHHMFLEAIAAGRPGSGHVADLTTGLSRFRVGQPTLHWHRDPRFSHLTLDDDLDDDSQDNRTNGGRPSGGQCLADSLRAASGVAEVAAVLLPAFARKLEDLLQATPGSVSGDDDLSELGADSLVAIEIGSWIWRTLGVDFAVVGILGSMSITKLCEDIAELVVAGRDEKVVGEDGGATTGEAGSGAGQSASRG